MEPSFNKNLSQFSTSGEISRQKATKQLTNQQKSTMAYEGEYETVEDYDEEDSGEEEEEVEEVVVQKRRTKKWKVRVSL